MDRLSVLTREAGRAVLAASHDLDLAGRFAHRIIIMNNGRIVADGGPDLLDGSVIPAVFGIERRDGAWWPA